MSGPNTNYDPVEVAALDPQVIDDAVQAGDGRAEGMLASCHEGSVAGGYSQDPTVTAVTFLTRR